MYHYTYDYIEVLYMKESGVKKKEKLHGKINFHLEM